MATTFHDYNGNQGTGTNNAEYNFSFPTFKQEEVKVEVDNVVKDLTTHFTVPTYSANTGGKIRFTAGNIPTLSTQKVRVYRQTDVDAAKATFTAGSALKANELNTNMTLLLRSTQDRTSDKNIQTHDLNDRAVTTDKIKDGNITTAKLANSVVTTTQIAAGTIVNDDISASAAIDGSKIDPDFGSQNLSTSGTAATGPLTVTGNITVSGTVDGRDLQNDFTKLDGIETSATADQTAAEIRTLVEAATDSNVFTDTDHSKLNNIETGATADQTAGEIKALYEGNSDTNVFTDAQVIKLGNIETAATADQTASEIKTLLQSDKLTLSEMNTTSLDSRYYTETEAEALFLRQDSSETIASGTAWSNTDGKVATTAAINARIIDLIDDVGGFIAIANQTSFPTTNPQGSAGQAAILSIGATTATLTPSGTTITIANGAGSGNTVTITGVPSVIPSGFGFLVESTSTLHTYTFHRTVPKASDVSAVASNITNVVSAGANLADIENFADLYQISTSAPTTRADGGALTVGDLWFDSSSNQVMMVYDGSSGDGFSPITPDQSTITAINSVSGHVTFQEDLGLITNAINTGSGNNSINTCGANIASINTVAADLNETTSEIDTVAGAITNINNVGNNISNVNAVHNNATNINAAVANATNINAAVSNASNINAAVSNASNINTVAGNNTNVNTVAGISSNITAVAGNATNINAVVSNATNINTVATNVSDVNNFVDRYQISNSAPTQRSDGTALQNGDLWFNGSSVAMESYDGSAGDGYTPIQPSATVIQNIANVTGFVTFVEDNGLITDAINTGTGNNSINAVGADITNVNTVAGSIANVNTTAGSISNVNTVATNIGNVNTVGNAIANVNRYADEYVIQSGTPSSPSEGDLWYNSTSNTLNYYNSSAWVAIAPGISGVINDANPQLANHLDCNDKNLTEVGTVSGNNLQLDFGTL